MPFITHKTSKQPIELYYEDYGTGQPVILIHGWPLSHRAWDSQVSAIVDAGFRCITYDRRGFGVSSYPWDGYDYSSLATDLNEIILALKLKQVALVGFSMGGGEVVRYLTDYGSENVKNVALISSIIPIVKKKEDNPNGVPEKDLKGIMDALKTDRVGFLKGFHKNFYNYHKNKDRVSEAQLQYDWTIASYASPHGTLQSAKAWAETDFRPELKNVTVPTLIVHGDADAIVPIKTAGDQAAKGIKNNTYKIIKDGPHGLNVTHSEEVNKILIAFLKS
ncbi:pimeloyl-ACP methyl ester carboxylesterase [Gelidibacter algens]|jgi:pimeloyl-ACP methyl ester carboxylesterase|uniref:Pimeloyl-ACP methyl ester carboxylesterase n=1 Tax=Gelidibacter algens TaxID=49280 RepID=A0A1A7QZS1_9FLAO|nr:alpha/beta hydrolase [Gelidibacter algens]OBX24773.1 arylesterase [Gelidibacter algens]RAJ26751.1 pimeloyl-ACP methyl ester carboxylesterase [Gelidibacter algens]